MSGVYIAIDPQPGNPASTFTGLEVPPRVTSQEAGTEYILLAHRLGSLQQGSPIYYRGIQVGEVTGYEFGESGQIEIGIFIREPHDQRVQRSSRFWKVSGIDVSVDASGINLEVESLISLISGGIEFDTPLIAEDKSRPIQPDSAFELHEGFASIGESKITKKVPYVLFFDGSVRGLEIGAPVEFRGIRIGTVTDIKVEIDQETTDIRIPVFIETEPQRWATRALLVKTERKELKPYEFAERLVKKGMRGQLQTGSLLTGKLFVDLDFHPDLPTQTLKYDGKYPEIPTVPSTMDQFRQTATDVLEKLRNLPLDKIAHELLETMEGTNRLANSPELIETVQTFHETIEDVQRVIRERDESLGQTFEDVQKLTRDLDQAVVELADSMEDTLSVARNALEIADPNSPMMVNLASTLKELSGAARSIRALADYLERHPEALVHGKGGSGGS